MITFDELMVAYLVSFLLTLFVCACYYIFFVRRPIKMLLMALHSSHDKREFPGELYVSQGPLSPLIRELNAFTKWAGEINSNVKEQEIRRGITADVAHDFRSPLTSIQGYAERLLEKGCSISEEEKSEYLKIILSNAQALNHLVNGLLELARFDAPAFSPSLQKFSIGEFADDIRNKFKLRAAQKSVKFDVQMQINLPPVYADRSLIDRALSNIIENALHYTSSEGEIKVFFHRVSRRIQVEVMDTGIGIPPEDLPHVFDRFYRVDKDRSQRTGGTGLGLSIAKAILDAHGSSLKLESSLGKGTRVSFQLPT